MTFAILILISALVIILLVAAKSFELRTKKSIWAKFGLEKTMLHIEGGYSALENRVHHIDAKNLAEYLKKFWQGTVQFYGVIQKISSEKIAQISNPTPPDHGNRAASFYLKTIKEEKAKAHLDFKPEDIGREHSE